MKKIIFLSGIIILLGIVIGIGKYILIDYSYIPNVSNFNINLEKLRALANDNTSELPLKINCIFTGKGELDKWTIAVNEKPISNNYVQSSFQIVYKNNYIILDTPMGKKQFDQFKYGRHFIKDNYEIMQKAMRKADRIIFTHEHWDHTGGLAKSSYIDEIIKKTILTKEQINSPLIKPADFSPDILKKIKPINYKKYYQAAPGVILIKAPGHTPGHQMIYVKLQNGNEYLFTGDIVWNFTNIEKRKARPLIVYLAGKENPEQIGNQICCLYEIYNNENEMINILPSHDPEVFESCFENNLLGNSFDL